MILNFNSSWHISSSKNNSEANIYSLTTLGKRIAHNERNYKAKPNEKFLKSKIDFGLSDLNFQIKSNLNYKDWFNHQIPKQVIDEYNTSQKNQSRVIKKYDLLDWYQNKTAKKQSIAKEMILSFGSEDDGLGEIKDLFLSNTKTKQQWKNFWIEYTKSASEFLKRTLPEFKQYQIDLHLDETTPHLHIIGAGFQSTPTAKQGLKFRLASASIFTKERLEQQHQLIRSELHRDIAGRLNQLLEQNNIYFNKQTNQIEMVDNPSLEHEIIEIKSNEINLDKTKFRVEDRRAAHLIRDIQNNEISKSDRTKIQAVINSIDEKQGLNKQEPLKGLITPEHGEMSQQMALNEVLEQYKLEIDLLNEENDELIENLNNLWNYKNQLEKEKERLAVANREFIKTEPDIIARTKQRLKQEKEQERELNDDYEFER